MTRSGPRTLAARLEWVRPREVMRLTRELPAVWADVTEERLEEILPRHARREGFRFLAARTEEGRLAGFSYGYLGAPGQWWHDLVAAALDEESRRRWLAPGHFELTELHVHPDDRRQGIGGLLHDELLAGVTSPTAVLSVRRGNEPALALYRGRGWQTILAEIRFTPGGEPYSIMARRLP